MADRLYSKIEWRLLPFLFVLYVAAFLDRVNVNHAQLSFKTDLGLSEDVYGFGAGLFFVGYFLFEVPSNLILARVGARRWIARIMITWAALSGAMVFAQGEWSFYTLRFLLGVAEAGFFPGMILYLSYWFPIRRRAQVVARFMTAIAVSNVIGAPLSSWIMTGLGGVAGLRDWQWLFLIEAAPSLLLGVAVLVVLPDRPGEARWLSDEERAHIESDLAADRAGIAVQGRHDLRAAFTEPRVWCLSLVYFTNAFANYGLGLWLAQIIKDAGTFTKGEAILLCGIPYALAMVAMVISGWNSDRTGERRKHVAVMQVVAALGMVGAAYSTGSPTMLVCCLAVAAAGICSALGPFWALPAAFLSGTAAAAGFALINALGNLGGFAGSFAVGHLKQSIGYSGGFIILAAVLAVGAALVLTLRVRR